MVYYCACLLIAAVILLLFFALEAIQSSLDELSLRIAVLDLLLALFVHVDLLKLLVEHVDFLNFGYVFQCRNEELDMAADRTGLVLSLLRSGHLVARQLFIYLLKSFFIYRIICHCQFGCLLQEIPPLSQRFVRSRLWKTSFLLDVDVLWVE